MTSPSAPKMSAALLPAGFADVLHPDATHEYEVRRKLMASFASWGYERVKPPLLENEEALKAYAPDEAISDQTFRMIDPASRKTIGLRRDMTPQVARIAHTRLADAPRPLRLCYAGEVVRVAGSQLRQEREFAQAGAELLGVSSRDADIEIISMTVEALAAIGIGSLTVDLCYPRLWRSLLDGMNADEETIAKTAAALATRDAAEFAALPGPIAEHFLELLKLSGPLETSLPKLKQLQLPLASQEQLAHMILVAEQLLEMNLPVDLTFDPLEVKGFTYQTGVGFSLFKRGVRGELGRGGRYDLGIEPSIGVTLYLDSVVRALQSPVEAGKRIFVPLHEPGDAARDLRAEGWTVIASLDDAFRKSSDLDMLLAEARRMRCTHLYRDGAARSLKELDAAAGA